MDLVRYFETSVTGKALLIGAMVLTLLVPLGMIERLVAERGQRHDAASAAVASTLGSQTVGGPILIVPFRAANSGDPAASDELYLLPEELDIVSDSKTKTLRAGSIEFQPTRLTSGSAVASLYPRQLRATATESTFGTRP
jgi:inner membrane protein